MQTSISTSLNLATRNVLPYLPVSESFMEEVQKYFGKDQIATTSNDGKPILIGPGIEIKSIFAHWRCVLSVLHACGML